MKRRAPHPHRWWVAFGATATAAVALCVGFGTYAATVLTPTELGSVAVGEWVDYTEDGFRVRVDSVEMRDTAPGASGEPVTLPAESGLEYVVVSLTVNPTPIEDGCEARCCAVSVVSVDGDHYSLSDPSASGASSPCQQTDEYGYLIEPTQPWTTSIIRVVPAASREDVQIQIRPFGQTDYWGVRP